MTPEQEQKLNDLSASIDAILERLDLRDEQQISNPLDRASQQVVYKDVLLFKRQRPLIVVPKGIITVEINGKEYQLLYT
jgi:hypothetical protein